MSNITPETITIEQAKQLITGNFKNGEHEMEANYPYSNDLNDNSCLMIAAYRNEHGQAWLGRVNFYPEDDGKQIIWKWDGTTTLNGVAKFVLPKHDAELERMIQEYNDTPFTEGKAYEQITAIFERVEQLGGSPLHWN